MSNKEKYSGSTSESVTQEVVEIAKVAMVQEWDCEAHERQKKGRRSKGTMMDIPSERSMYMPVKEKEGPTLKHLFVRIVQTARFKKIKISRMTVTLFYKDPDTGEMERVVDVDVVSPLPHNGEKTESWPHYHFGQTRTRFSKEEVEALGNNPNRQLNFFLEKANMELDKPIDLNIAPKDFRLE